MKTESACGYCFSPLLSLFFTTHHVFFLSFHFLHPLFYYSTDIFLSLSSISLFHPCSLSVFPAGCRGKAGWWSVNSFNLLQQCDENTFNEQTAKTNQFMPLVSTVMCACICVSFCFCECVQVCTSATGVSAMIHAYEFKLLSCFCDWGYALGVYVVNV